MKQRKAYCRNCNNYFTFKYRLKDPYPSFWEFAPYNWNLVTFSEESDWYWPLCPECSGRVLSGHTDRKMFLLHSKGPTQCEIDSHGRMLAYTGPDLLLRKAAYLYAIEQLKESDLWHKNEYLIEMAHNWTLYELEEELQRFQDAGVIVDSAYIEGIANLELEYLERRKLDQASK